MARTPLPKESTSQLATLENLYDVINYIKSTSQDIHSLYLYLSRFNDDSNDTITTVTQSSGGVGPPGPAGVAGNQGVDRTVAVGEVRLIQDSYSVVVSRYFSVLGSVQVTGDGVLQVL